ncbi:hypothetical protein TNCV_2479491 [Trichonephila clavipes]|nr:hypothetical protein TNCV_2479491 [Trichonephila clavipes]
MKNQIREQTRPKKRDGLATSYLKRGIPILFPTLAESLGQLRELFFEGDGLLKYGKHDGTDIVRTIKASRVRWLGYLYRYANVFPFKTVTFSKIEGTRHRGRPPIQ